MVKRTAIRVSRRYRAPPERIFDAWLDPKVACRWLFATAARPMARVAIDPRVAGSFRLEDDHAGTAIAYAGEYTEIVPPRRLAFTLSAAHHPRVVTQVRVEIVPLESGCGVTVTNENVPRDHASGTEARWTGILYGLGEMLRSDQPADAAPPPRRKR